MPPEPVTATATTPDRAGSGWFDPVCSARSLAVMRIAVVGYALVLVGARTMDGRRIAARAVGWEPVGILAPLSEPLGVTAVTALGAVAMASGVAALIGWRFRLSGPVFAVSALGITTLASSWGQVFHTDNLVILHLFVLAVSPAGDALAAGGRRSAEPSVVYGHPIRLAAVVTAVTYALAGWAKLRIGGGDWLDGETLRGLVAHDNLRKELIGAPSTPLAGPAVRQAWMFGPAAWISVVVELGAPLALIGPRAARRWCAAAWVFHLAVVALMTVSFVYPLLGLAFVPTLLTTGAIRPDRWTFGRSR